MNSTVAKSDADIKTDVLAELKYEPTVKVTNIGVLVKDGAVTLNGNVPSYGEKWDAVAAAKRVSGVKAIADDIEVKFADSLRRTDGEIAATAANQIKWSTTIPDDSVAITVREGNITLEGDVEWGYQRRAAVDSVQYLLGVKGVNNLINIKPKASAKELEASIKSAFIRSALLDYKKIQVEVSGATVILRGKVRNYTEREEAERVAWAASGVNFVDNQLHVQWSWFAD